MFLFVNLLKVAIIVFMTYLIFFFFWTGFHIQATWASYPQLELNLAHEQPNVDAPAGPLTCNQPITHFIFFAASFRYVTIVFSVGKTCRGVPCRV